jgi:hypothetical protein
MVVGEVVVAVVDSLGVVLEVLGEEEGQDLHHPQEDLCRCFGQLYHEQRGKLYFMK